MRLVSWNLGGAFGPYIADHDRAWHWLAAVDADIALLQECVPPDWARERWTILHLPFTHWASAIALRPGLTAALESIPEASILGRFGSYIATAEVETELGTLLVASVHARAAEVPGWVIDGNDPSEIARTSVGVPWSNDAAFCAYRDLTSGRRFLVGGDWNTARYLGSDGRPNAEGQEFFDRAAEAGWVEVSLDGEGHEGKSWFGSANPRPYQPDHVFADESTARLVASFAIDPWPVTALGLSDHAPLMIELARSTEGEDVLPT